MGFFITGGLFVIAILAVLGSVFMVRNDDSTPDEKRDTTGSSDTGTAPASQGEEQAEHISSPTPSPQSHNEEQTNEADEQVYIADGQVHELVTELHNLHEQAQILSQRLGTLSEIAYHIEQTQNGHSANAAESHSAQDQTS